MGLSVQGWPGAPWGQFAVVGRPRGRRMWPGRSAGAGDNTSVCLTSLGGLWEPQPDGGSDVASVGGGCAQLMLHCWGRPCPHPQSCCWAGTESTGYRGWGAPPALPWGSALQEAAAVGWTVQGRPGQHRGWRQLWAARCSGQRIVPGTADAALHPLVCCSIRPAGTLPDESRPCWWPWPVQGCLEQRGALLGVGGAGSQCPEQSHLPVVRPWPRTTEPPAACADALGPMAQGRSRCLSLCCGSSAAAPAPALPAVPKALRKCRCRASPSPQAADPGVAAAEADPGPGLRRCSSPPPDPRARQGRGRSWGKAGGGGAPSLQQHWQHPPELGGPHRPATAPLRVCSGPQAPPAASHPLQTKLSPQS